MFNVNVVARLGSRLFRRKTIGNGFIGVALAACALGLSSMTNVAQAQVLEKAQVVERDKARAEVPPQQEFVDPSRFYTGVCTVGPRSSDVIFTCFGIGFPSASPRSVHCQLRNSSTDRTAYPDQFSCQVVSTSVGSVTVRIRRMDDGTGSSAWGQDLRMNLFIVN